MEGAITLNNYEAKIARIEEAMPNPVIEYVQNFSDTKNVMQMEALGDNEVAMAFAGALTRKFENNQKAIVKEHQEHQEEVKVYTAELVFGGMDKVNTEEKKVYLDALVKKEIPKAKENVFNQCIEEENRLISRMGK